MLKANALYSGTCYTNEKNRKWVAVGLLMSSYGIFQDSRLIEKLELLKCNYGQGDQSFEKLVQIIPSIKNPILDLIKIIICFENYFKVELLLKGFVVHNVDTRVNGKKYKLLGERQKTQPVKISEIKRAEGLIGKRGNAYCFESLKETTIPLSKIISEQAYIKHLHFPTKLFDILKGINKKRHSLHFLVATSYSYSESTIDEYMFLKSIVNKRLVRKHNSLCKFLGFSDFLIKSNI